MPKTLFNAQAILLSLYITSSEFRQAYPQLIIFARHVRKVRNSHRKYDERKREEMPDAVHEIRKIEENDI